jgi:hypothetical protein
VPTPPPRKEDARPWPLGAEGPPVTEIWRSVGGSGSRRSGHVKSAMAGPRFIACATGSALQSRRLRLLDARLCRKDADERGEGRALFGVEQPPVVVKRGLSLADGKLLVDDVRADNA